MHPDGPSVLIDEDFRGLRAALAVLGSFALGILILEVSGVIPSVSLGTRERIVLAALAAASCGGALLIPQLRVRIDRARRLLYWEQRRASHATRYEYPLDATLHVDVTSHTERRDGTIQPTTTYQIRLRTPDRSLPLSLRDFSDEDSAERRAAELRLALGLARPAPPASPEDELTDWLRKGGPFEAIRRLRARDGLSLEEATRRVREHPPLSAPKD
jgi:hypothetical protein